MTSLQSPLCDFGWKARDFDLPGVYGKCHSLANARGSPEKFLVQHPNGLLVMFICNHCPYVKSIRDCIVRDTRELQQHGINSIAIISNDPADSITCGWWQANTAILSLMYGTRPSRPPRITVRYARQISSASAPIWNCNTVAGWMHRARKQSPMRRAIYSMRCCKLPKLDKVRASRSPAWVIR